MLKEIILSSGKIFGIRGVTVAANFFSMLLIAYLVGIEVYGEFVITWTFAQIISSFISLGLPVYLLREFAIHSPSDERKISLQFISIYVVFIPALLAVTIGVVGLVWQGLGLWLPQDYSSNLLIMSLILGYCLNINSNYSSAFHAVGYQGFSMFQKDALPQVFALAAAVIISNDLNGILTLICWQLIIWMIVAAGLLQYKNAKYPILHMNGNKKRAPLSFWGSATLGVIWSQIDILIGSYFLSSSELGAYNIFRRVANLAALPVTVSTWVTVGDFSRAFATGDQTAIIANNRRALIIAIPAGVILLTVCLFLFPLLNLVYSIPGGFSTFSAYLLLLMQSAIIVCFAPTFCIAATSGLEKWAMAARLLGVVSYLGSVFLVIPFVSSDMVANALAVTIGALAAHLFLSMKLQRSFHINPTGLALLTRYRLKC